MSDANAFDDLFDADFLPARATHGDFVKKFAGLHSAWQDARAQCVAQLAKADGPLAALTQEYVRARAALDGVAVKGNKGVFVVAEGVSGDAKAAASEKISDFYRAQNRIKNFLTGTEEAGVKASQELQASYARACKAEKPVMKLMNGLAGKLRVEGVQASLNDNMALWDKSVRKGRAPVMFGRVAVTALGATVMGHAVLTSKTSDGQDRSLLLRVAEGGVGAAMIAGGTVLGGAR